VFRTACFPFRSVGRAVYFSCDFRKDDCVNLMEVRGESYL
jgi:hypothetical protein